MAKMNWDGLRRARGGKKLAEEEALVPAALSDAEADRWTPTATRRQRAPRRVASPQGTVSSDSDTFLRVLEAVVQSEDGRAEFHVDGERARLSLVGLGATLAELDGLEIGTFRADMPSTCRLSLDSLAALLELLRSAAEERWWPLKFVLNGPLELGVYAVQLEIASPAGKEGRTLRPIVGLMPSDP